MHLLITYPKRTRYHRLILSFFFHCPKSGFSEYQTGNMTRNFLYILQQTKCAYARGGSLVKPSIFTGLTAEIKCHLKILTTISSLTFDPFFTKFFPYSVLKAER